MQSIFRINMLRNDSGCSNLGDPKSNICLSKKLNIHKVHLYDCQLRHLSYSVVVVNRYMHVY